MERFREEISAFGNFPTLFMGIVKKDNGLTFYDGKLRIVDASGHVVADDSTRTSTTITSGKKSSLGAISSLPTTSRKDFRTAFTALDRWLA